MRRGKIKLKKSIWGEGWRSIPILMNAAQVKPIVLLRAWPEELDLAVTECTVETFVSYVAETIKCYFGPSFLQKNRFHGNVI